MLALILIGGLILDDRSRLELRPSLKVLAVGLHSCRSPGRSVRPCSPSWAGPLALLGSSGLVLGWVWEPTAAPALAVLAGVVMLVTIAADALRPAPEVSQG